MSTITSRDEITPGTYTVKTRFGVNSTKRFHDAVKNLKAIRNSEGCDATFDGSTGVWTVTIADTEDGRVYATSRLAAAAASYGAIVERA